MVDYFKSRGVRSRSHWRHYLTDAWTGAGHNPTQFGMTAAEAAQRLGVGIEIDYEENTNPNLTGLQAFIMRTGQSCRTSLRK